MPEALYTAEEVAELAGVTSRTVRQWARHGRLRAAKRIGNAQVFTSSEVRRVLSGPRPRVGRPKSQPQRETLLDAS